MFVFRLNLAVTYICNSRCRICDIWKIYLKEPMKVKEELQLAQFELLFKGLPQLTWLHITGGEPFLRHDLVDIINLAVQNSKIMLLDTSTNGLDMHRVLSTVEELLCTVKIPYFSIGVSFDGPQKLHDYVRGIPGSWEKTLKTLVALKELEKSYANFEVHINYTISTYNAGNLAKMYQELIRYVDISRDNISLSLEHKGIQFQNFEGTSTIAQFKNNALKDIQYILNTSINYAKCTKILQYIRTKFKREFVKLMLRYLDNPKEIIVPCEACRLSVYVNPYGDFFPCTIWGIKLGNIKETEIKKILYSKLTKQVRNSIMSGKCPNCWSGCESWLSLLMHRAGKALFSL
ncbi:MAG: radical SAM protein [Candidatus Bathyarchaeia archaeon]